MKKINTLLLFIFLIGSSQNIQSQFWKKVKKRVKAKVENKVLNKIDKETDKTLDKTLDGKKKEQPKEIREPQKTTVKKDVTPKKKTVKKQKVVWNKFDFVPGDTVIFEDMPSAEEENGEFPSRWDLVKGQVEIAEVDGEPVLIFMGGEPAVVPYLKNSKEDYLPEIFTIEFDFYKPKDGNRAFIYLFDTKNQQSLVYPDFGDMYMHIDGEGIREHLEDIDGEDPNINYDTRTKARWIHISIAFTKGKLKVYMDDTRVINIPHYTGNPSGLTLNPHFADLGDNKPYYFKNIRIAKGGVIYYKRIISEGKIIVNGIKFDVNKATLRPESMGPINKIYKLMVKNPDFKFSVEGHTDSDGGDNFNLELSKNRGKAVMEKLIEMGIDKSRLKFNGFGESKPIDNNASPEGKANNRRVEFVKF